MFIRIFTRVLVVFFPTSHGGRVPTRVSLLRYPSRFQHFTGLVKIALFGISLARSRATAQLPRLTITLEPPPALISVGSVLAAPNGNIVVNPDGFGGYQDGAIFILDSTGRLLRRIPAVEIPAKPYPVLLAPTARAVLPDGSLIVDYVRERFFEPGLLRLRLDPEGVAVTPGSDDYLPAGPLMVQADGSLIVAPDGWGVPVVRFIQQSQGERRGFLSFDHAFYRNMISSAGGQRLVSYGNEPNGKLGAYSVKDPQATNSQPRFTRFSIDGRLDPDQSDPTPDPAGDAASKLAAAVFGIPGKCQQVQQVITQPDGRILVVYGQECSRFPRPKLGRLLADGRLDVEVFEPPNRFVSRRIPSFKADGLTPGRWYLLERSVGAESSVWEGRSEPFQAPAGDRQPLNVRQYFQDLFDPVDPVIFCNGPVPTPPGRGYVV